MNYIYRFDQVLTIREQEKSEVETAYKEAVTEFEIMATELYELLKKKEDTIQSQENKMRHGFSVNGIKHYAYFIEGIEKSIDHVQRKVQQARSKMTWHEEKLLEKSIEVRKYEKMKEKDLEIFKAEEERVEANRLDELASAQYFNREIR